MKIQQFGFTSLLLGALCTATLYAPPQSEAKPAPAPKQQAQHKSILLSISGMH